MHAAKMADELSEREQALRRLPLPYSLALRLRDIGLASDVICQYVESTRLPSMACTESPKRNFVRRSRKNAATTTAADAP